MSKIISIHEYVLKPEVETNTFEHAIHEAEQRGLFQLPGLVKHHFLRGIRGTRKAGYTAIWIYESREAWERLWGPPDEPIGKDAYPERWKIWEDDVLAPFLDRDPDNINYTAYEEI